MTTTAKPQTAIPCAACGRRLGVEVTTAPPIKRGMFRMLHTEDRWDDENHWQYGALNKWGGISTEWRCLTPCSAPDGQSVAVVEMLNRNRDAYKPVYRARHDEAGRARLQYLAALDALEGGR